MEPICQTCKEKIVDIPLSCERCGANYIHDDKICYFKSDLNDERLCKACSIREQSQLNSGFL